MGRTPALRDEIFLVELKEWRNGAFYYSLLLLLPVVRGNPEDSGKTDTLLC